MKRSNATALLLALPAVLHAADATASDYWPLAQHPLVATTEITWEDGQQQKLHSLERPQHFFEDNLPAVLLFASDTGSKREHSFNVRIPLGTPQ